MPRVPKEGRLRAVKEGGNKDGGWVFICVTHWAQTLLAELEGREFQVSGDHCNLAFQHIELEETLR